MGRGRQGATRERIFGFVREQLLAGRPPTVREVQHAMGLRAVESARAHLEKLVADGRLAKETGKARGYRLPGDPHGPALAPLVGRVQAGGLTEAIEAPDGYVAVTSRENNAALFALRVQGDSMTGAGILEDDVVIVDGDASVRSGNVVVALVSGEATVKTLHRRGRRVELRPENPDYETIVPDPAELQILGRVIEIRRSL